MNTLTAIITTLVMATAISYNAASASSDESNAIGPPATYTEDTTAPIGPPPSYDGGSDTATCLSCG